MESLVAERELILRELIGEMLQRGHFDPFFPFDAARKLAIMPPERTYVTQKAWEERLAALAEVVV